MLLHTVLFWLKPDVSPSDRALFERGLRSLTTISTVTFASIGTPAATRRPIIDSSYSYKLVVGFADLAGHAVYQDADIHEAFRQQCGSWWSTVTIYDSTELAP